MISNAYNFCSDKGEMIKSMITILLVDDHEMVRQGFLQLLETYDDFKVVAEASTGEDGFRKCQQLNPDIVLLDISLPGEGGLATLRRLHARNEQVKVVVLSMHDDPAIIIRAMESGACGFLSKSAFADELRDALIIIHEGGKYIEKRLNDKVHEQGSVGKNPVNVLTSREFEVFGMLSEGKSVLEISELLHLSPKTAGAHRTSIMKKLQLRNSAELVRVALLWNVSKL